MAAASEDTKRNEITKGNIWSIITTLCSAGVIFTTIVLAYGELKTKDALHDSAIAKLDQRMTDSETRGRTDHDILIDIRADVRSLKETLDRIIRGQRADAGKTGPIP